MELTKGIRLTTDLTEVKLNVSKIGVPPQPIMGKLTGSARRKTKLKPISIAADTLESTTSKKTEAQIDEKSEKSTAHAEKKANFARNG